MSADSYNLERINSGAVTAADLTSLVRVAQGALHVNADGYLGPKTLDALHGAKPDDPWDPVDRRESHHPTYRDVTGKLVPYEPKQRPWSEVTGICLHQTACVLGEKPERYDTVGAHFAVTRSGTVVWLCDVDRIVYHGNGWNNRTVGIEIDGLYAGIEGDQKTVWDDPSTAVHETGQTLTSLAIAATRELIRQICKGVAARGGRVTKLVAHRQSSMDRRNDPGMAIWRSIALPMMTELGLDDGGPGFKIGGYPIPEAWDPSKKGIAY